MKNKKYCKLIDSNNIFEIISENNGKVTLKDKNKILHTKSSNIQIVDKPLNRNTRTAGYTITTNDAPAENEIMLRHLSRDEALIDLDRFIDKALAHHIPQVRIIHGRHGGVIRQAVREYLDNHPNVESYEYADFAHGSIGATVAKLGKRKV
ncbi:MAG: Smr/MutS family protein [Clostridia bacterium]|nr:Smr/MutS family protein [Clostridia bacterium]